MGGHRFARCSCYFSDNIFVKSVGKHFRFQSKDQFHKDYAQAIDAEGYDYEVILHDVLLELNRRQDVVNNRKSRLKSVEEKFQRKDTELYSLKSHFLSETFQRLCSFNREQLKAFSISKEFDLYRIPVFTAEFCNRLRCELNALRNSKADLMKPNTMNNYGVILDEVGFQSFFSELRRDFLNPIARQLFPMWVADENESGDLDSHRSFTVSYSTDTESDLAWHFDNAEVTINIALAPADAYEGGELVFLSPDTSLGTIPISHKQGWGILHVGRQNHAALPVLSGTRENLIIWMRSSAIRNQLCPMCGQIPEIVLCSDSEDFGDGFTTTTESVDVCSLS